MMTHTYFITATGTGCGKTFVASGLARALHQRGVRATVLKPVMSGVCAENLAESDAAQALAACGIPLSITNIAAISPWRFIAPLSPQRAAALEGSTIDFSQLITWCQKQCANCQSTSTPLLIEGVGGVMTPLTQQHTVREWVAALDLPTLLVVGDYLGAVSHTLTAIAALHAVGITPAALILNAATHDLNLNLGINEARAALEPYIDQIPLFSLRHNNDEDLVTLTEHLF